jgi:hypothetical protein
VDACQQDRVVAEPDLADPVTRRWLAFTRPALRAGARAVFGFPLRIGTVRRLRAFAFSSDRLLADVAEDVVARRLRLG